MRKPFHPITIGMYPVLMLLAANVSQVKFADTLRVFYASLLIIIFISLLSYLLIRNWQKAALLASLFLIFFFSYGHVYSLLQDVSIGSFTIGRTRVLLPLYLILLAVFIWWILSRTKNVRGLTEIFNIASLVLVIFPIYTIASYTVKAEMIRSSQQAEVPVELSQRFQGEPPSIYYIVLDMHARTDVLQKIYQYDNSWFIDALKEKGFYIADQSTSNYSSTLQSISSSLNMEYINYLEDVYGADSNNREPLGLSLSQNKVMKLFQQMGYKLGAFPTDDFYTEFRSADEYVKPTPEEVRRYQNVWSLNSFEGLFLQTTLARMLFNLGFLSSDATSVITLETPYQLHRLTVLNTVDHLPDFARKKEPYFVFAHIVSPHPPYIFGPNGEEIAHDQPFSLSGPARQNGGPKYQKLYIDQLKYTDEIILKAVDKILSESKTPPIIIIQGDHGPVSYLGEQEVAKSNMKEQHSILNAYYFPGQKYDLLYKTVTPVNSFRIILNTFFDGHYEMLPDRNYFLPHARPYDFTDVTDRVQTDPLLP